MTNTQDKVCVIIGASHAGCHIAEAVRKNGWEGRILVIGEESYLPYNRPPLSKDFLAGKKEINNILIKPEKVYEKLDIEFMLDAQVERIDRDQQQVVLANGDAISYDKLGIATGARVRKLPIPGAELAGVCYLRDAKDVLGIKQFVGEGKRAVILGAGYIGLETAAALRKLGMEVTVLEMMPRILQRVTSPVISQFYDRVHTEEGVNIVTDVAVTEIVGGEAVQAVNCKDGSEYPADLVIIGAGVLPNVEMAEACGLKVENGIVVDEYAVTSDPNIVAAGDCVWHENPIYGRWLRLESVQNAHDQAKIAGASICGVQNAYSELPWFWSEQYDLRLQIAGLSQGFDDVVIRGSTEEGRSFAAFYFEGDKLLAVDAVNMPMAFMMGKQMLLKGIAVDKDKIRDLDVNLKTLLA